MPNDLVHAISQKVSQVVKGANADSQEPAAPAEPVARVDPSNEDVAIQEERSVRGLTKSLNKWREQALAAQVELEKLRGSQGAPKRDEPAAPDRTANPNDDLAESIVKEITDAESKVNWKAEAERLAQELKASKVEQKYRRDPLNADLIKRGLPVEQLDDEKFIELLREAQDTGEDTIPHNNVSISRGQSQSDYDEAILKKALWGEVR